MKRRAWWIAGALLLVAVIAIGVAGSRRAADIEAAARAGRAEATSALRSLQAGDAVAARAAFDRAALSFEQGRVLLGPGWLRAVPGLGRQLDALDDLLTIGVEGSGAGSESAQLLGKASGVAGDDRLGQLLSLAHPHLDKALTHLTVVADRSDRLGTDGLLPPLADAVTDVETVLAPLRGVLARSASLLALERYLFSTQHRFLVLAQNNAQLRPTGGLPGTYGLVELGPEGVRLSRFADVHHLPRDTLFLPAPPGQEMREQLYFQNANWWIDFPTSAETMLRFWDSKEPRQPQVDGVIALDLPTIRELLKVFGPIRVPESTVPLTWRNVVEQLTYVVEVEYSGARHTGGKKNAVVSLAKAVMGRLVHLTDAEFRPVMAALATAADERHLQVYLTDPAGQAAVVGSGWSGALNPPADTTDLLAVSNAIVRRPAKGNLGVDKSLDYQVELQPDGSAVGTLALGYRKSPDVPLGSLQDRFRDYLRVHRAEATTLSGASSFTPVPDATGLPTFARSFDLAKGTSTSMELRTVVPRAVREGAPAPVPGGVREGLPEGGLWHYRLVLARQADLVETAATIGVTAPAGWRVVRSSAVFRGDGSAVDVSGDAGHARIATALRQDLLVDVVLQRA